MRAIKSHARIAALIFFGMFTLGVKPVLADTYFQRLRNDNIRDQLSLQTGRILPQSDNLALALDTYLWGTYPAQKAYFHGPGYWVNTFAEWTPRSDLTFNLKLVGYHPSWSYGYAFRAEVFPLLGVEWSPKLTSDGEVSPWGITLRWGDLDRQTYGAGALLLEKEIQGLNAELSHRPSQLRFRSLVDGSGLNKLSGDTWVNSLDWRNQLLGAQLIRGFPQVDSGTTSINFLATSLFSFIPLHQNHLLKLEAGYAHGTDFAYAGYQFKNEYVTLSANYRHYGNGISNRLGVNSEFEYVTVETWDKAYDDPRTHYSFGSPAQSYSTRALWSLPLSSVVELAGDIEWVRFEMRRARGRTGIDTQWVHRNGVVIRPFRKDRREHLFAYFGNKQVFSGGKPTDFSGLSTPFYLDAGPGVDMYFYF